MSNTDQGTREWRFYIQDMIECSEKVLSESHRPLTVSYKRNALLVNPFVDVIYLIYLIYRPMCYLSQRPCLFHDSQAVMVRLISALLEGQPH